MKRKAGMKQPLIALLLTVTLLVTMVQAAMAAPAENWSEITLEETYSYGTVFVIPQRTVTVGETTVQAQASLICPDAAAVDTAEVLLDQSGVYTLKYTAQVGAAVYERSETFLVKEPYYTFTSANSSAQWGQYAHAATSGLMVRLADGDSMRFNQVIDVSEVTINDLLVEAFVTPDMKGAADFKQLLFTFTDVEDPGITMTISARASSEGDGYPISYFLAAGNGQLLSGWEAAWNRLHINNEWGQQIPHSFTLAYNENFASFAAQPPDAFPMRLSYDAESLQAYVGGLMIIDFDNPAYFSELWSGFPSGKVYLSVSAGAYIGETANFCITRIKDMDLQQTIFEDREGPVITVDTGYDTLPDGKSGMAYPVPSATAQDKYCGETQVKTRVFYNYGTSNRVNVQFSGDAFTPQTPGRYAIVYEASDKFGNVTREVKFVQVRDSVPQPEITITGKPAKTMDAGQLLAPVAFEAGCGNGQITVTITAKSKDKELQIPQEGIRIDEAGSYLVTYTATDYLGQTASDAYELTVEIPDAPMFVDVPEFPKYLISGSSYVLPELFANDYSSGTLVRTPAGATLTDENGETQIPAGGSFTPKVSANGQSVTVTYRCGKAAYTVEVPVVVAWVEEDGRPRLQLQNYFCAAGEQVSLEKKTNGVTVTALSSDAGWTFANSFVAEQFEISLRGIPEVDQYDALRLVMTDTQNPQLSVEARLLHRGQKNAELQLGDMTVGMDDPMVSETPVNIGYSNGRLVIGTAGLNIKTYASGEPFAGFPSGRIYVSVYFVNAEEGAGYDVVSMNGHAMNNLTSDKTGPKVSIAGDYGGSYKIGDIARIPAAFACDTMDPNCTISLTVRDADGEIAKDIHGTALSGVSTEQAYEIELTAYGQYIVELVAADTFNKNANSTTMRYALNVDDDQAPVIELTSGVKTQAKVGDVVVFPSFTVSDNITAVENIVVRRYYVTTTGVMYAMTGESNAVKMTAPGIFELRITAMDENGNVRLYQTWVTVQE